MSVVNNPRRALAALILFTLLLRVGWAALLETGNDEAYNYLYTVYPAWSYFDHPPMTMWIDKAGLLLCGGIIHPLTLRLGYLLLFAGSTWILYGLTARWYGAWAGFYAALALNLSAYYTGAAGALAVPDGPFLFFVLLTIWGLSEALIASPTRLRPWLWVGLAWGGAMLTKYLAIFLPAGALVYILVTPKARRLLLTPGPYVAAAIGVAAFTPVIIWNAANGWASFVFQGSRALGWQIRPAGPIIMLLGTMAVLCPWIWFSLVRTLATRLRVFRELTDIDRFLVCLAILPLAFFLAISCGRKMLMHWPLMGFVSLFCLVGARWAELAEARPVFMRRRMNMMAGAILAVTLFVLIQARSGFLSFPTKDPCFEFSGWESVGMELKKRGLIDKPNTFIFSRHWEESGHLAFELRNQAKVLCYNSGDARGFAFWSRPEEWVGKDGLLVSLDNDSRHPEEFAEFFEHIETVAIFPMTRGGNPFRSVRVYRCNHQMKPFPFTYDLH